MKLLHITITNVKFITHKSNFPPKLFSKGDTMVSFEFSIFDLVTMMAVLVLAVLYVFLLLKLKPSAEGKDPYKEHVLPEKRKPPPDELIFANSLKTKEKTTPPQVTQNQIDSQKIRNSHVNTVRPPTPPEKNQEAPKPVIRPENQSFNNHCVHHFSYLRKLPKNTPIPSECLACPQIVDCMTTLMVDKKPVKSHVT